jgi:cytochrome c oxidase subunit 2
MLVRIIALFEESVMPKPYTTIQHHTVLEWVWTLVPTFILLTIAGPSFSLLYLLEDFQEPDVVFKVLGQQWY